MTINRELFRKVYDQITAHPENHDQSSFEVRDLDGILEGLDEEDREGYGHRVDGESVCGTTRCVAGWALHLHAPDRSIWETADQIAGGSDTPAWDGAAKLLGLDEGQARELFSGHLPEWRAVELVAEYAGIDEGGDE